jgi:hypothetical protein
LFLFQLVSIIREVFVRVFDVVERVPWVVRVSWGAVGEFRVDVPRVDVRFDFGDERRFYFLVVDGFPIDGLEEWVCFDVVKPIVSGPKSLVRVFDE